MVSEIRIYVEGGGDQRSGKAAVREGFSKFLLPSEGSGSRTSYSLEYYCLRALVMPPSMLLRLPCDSTLLHSMFYLLILKAMFPNLPGDICRIVIIGQYKEFLMTIVI